jgi:hypothetical protein
MGAGHATQAAPETVRPTRNARGASLLFARSDPETSCSPCSGCHRQPIRHCPACSTQDGREDPATRGPAGELQQRRPSTRSASTTTHSTISTISTGNPGGTGTNAIANLNSNAGSRIDASDGPNASDSAAADNRTTRSGGIGSAGGGSRDDNNKQQQGSEKRRPEQAHDLWQAVRHAWPIGQDLYADRRLDEGHPPPDPAQNDQCRLHGRPDLHSDEQSQNLAQQ